MAVFLGIVFRNTQHLCRLAQAPRTAGARCCEHVHACRGHARWHPRLQPGRLPPRMAAPHQRGAACGHSAQLLPLPIHVHEHGPRGAGVRCGYSLACKPTHHGRLAPRTVRRLHIGSMPSSRRARHIVRLHVLHLHAPGRQSGTTAANTRTWQTTVNMCSTGSFNPPRACALHKGSRASTIGERRRFATLAPYEDDMADILQCDGVASRPPAAGAPMPWCMAGVPIRSSLLRMPIPLSMVLSFYSRRPTFPAAGERRRPGPAVVAAPRSPCRSPLASAPGRLPAARVQPYVSPPDPGARVAAGAPPRARCARLPWAVRRAGTSREAAAATRHPQRPTAAVTANRQFRAAAMLALPITPPPRLTRCSSFHAPRPKST